MLLSWKGHLMADAGIVIKMYVRMAARNIVFVELIVA